MRDIVKGWSYYAVLNKYAWGRTYSCEIANVDSSNNSIFMIARKNSIAAGSIDFEMCFDWKYSELNTINLNTNFIKNIGLEWTNKIATTIWKTGANNQEDLLNVEPSKVLYNEMNSSTTYTAKLCLPYLNDFAFAASPNAWQTVLESYSSFSSINWMSDSSSNSFWSITRFDAKVSVISSNIIGLMPGSNYEDARPVFFLNSDVTFVSGTSSDSNFLI